MTRRRKRKTSSLSVDDCAELKLMSSIFGCPTDYHHTWKRATRDGYCTGCGEYRPANGLVKHWCRRHQHVVFHCCPERE